MGEIINSIILGIIQGLTEFLPVSSSGHLEIAKFILGDDSVAKESLMMSVVLHAATALSTIIVFRKDIIELISGIFTFDFKSEEWQFAIKIVLSMIPAVFIGLKYDELLETMFDKQILLVGCMLIVTGILLFLADRAKTSDKSVSIKDSIIIGVAQAIAMLPGISRSGATISTSVLLGIDKGKAARFSFLMVVPLIFGKVAKDLLDDSLSVSGNEAMPLILGFLAAFFTGLFACTLMIKLVKNSKLLYFSIYCFIVGALAISYKLFY